MSQTVITETIPIYTDDAGRMRVSGTRVLIDLVVSAYGRGETPETIVQMYPTLTLDKVYLTIGYYLRHREPIDAYIARMKSESESALADYRANPPSHPSRDELRARLAARDTG